MGEHEPVPEITPLGEAALLMTLGNAISESVIRQVHRLHAWLRANATATVLDIVPAYASLLVTFAPSDSTREELQALLRRAVEEDQPDIRNAASPNRSHVIPVHYGGEDGPDLDLVAGAHGLSSSQVIMAHTGRLYHVAFLGFLPGFAYLMRLSSRIATPRLRVPRPRVAAGSVGLADFQTGVYPVASPGGWQIIGRTGVPVWEPTSSEPALFSPGDTVRFVSSDEASVHSARSEDVRQVLNPAFEVVDAQGLTTIQDEGWHGFADRGLGVGGSFDARAAQDANALVGNRIGAAVLEMTWTGPTLRALRNVTLTLTGADFHCWIGGVSVPPAISWFVRAGTQIHFQPEANPTGMRAYLAVAGGFDAPIILGSRSTCLLAGFGGVGGRPLKTGDILGTSEAIRAPVELAGKRIEAHSGDISRADREVRFVPFRGVQKASSQALRDFARHDWILGDESDRMGLKFSAADGTVLAGRQRRLASFGVVAGAIQLPPGGNPVVLGVDHQTTGGYPLLGVVMKSDIRLLAQLRPGATIRFVPVEL